MRASLVQEDRMKEDVLEQVLDDYLMHRGYFTRHNLRFKPSQSHVAFEKRADSVASDIDVIGIHPLLEGEERVAVVSCKAWQGGFNPASKVAEITGNKIISGREAWKGFRELCQPKWSEAFLAAIEAATGARRFTYYTVVTKLLNRDSREQWEGNPAFRAAIDGNPIRILTLTEMLDYLWGALTQTPAASEIGRAIQLMKAAEWRPSIPTKTVS
jgi:hypothetical protein